MTSGVNGPGDVSPDLMLVGSNFTIPILLYVLDHEGCTRVEMYEAMSNRVTPVNRLRSLEAAGLIEIRLAVGTRAGYLYLTEKGREYAETLSRLNGLEVVEGGME